MAIEPIARYAMPTVAPQNRLSWRPDQRRSALLIHDMQRHFLAPYAGEHSPVTELVANISALREHCASMGIPVIYSAQPPAQSPEQRGLLQERWGAGIPDAAQARIIDALAPRDGEVVVTKWRYSAFHRTELGELLIERGCDQLIICGLYAHIGVLTTAIDAFSHDIQPLLVADAVADFSPAHHQMALNHVAELCAVTLTTEQVIAALAASARTTTTTS
ncbi:isochorismatase family protein [Streptosporangium canum]|uniref:isochorismatase family protein n=1 Tax=Streptosporangium canum TaxID=324952 RepID=UPI00369C6987